MGSIIHPVTKQMNNVIIHRRICHSYQRRLQVVLLSGKRKENTNSPNHEDEDFPEVAVFHGIKQGKVDTVKLDLVKRK